MPNHCENEIQIYSGEGLAPIRDLIINEESGEKIIDFNLLVPQPEEVRNSPDMLGDQDRTTPNWYDWNCSNWGTKWNAYGCEVTQDIDEYDDLLELRFTTAWAMPDAWIAKLVEKVLEHDPKASVCGFYRIEGFEAAGVWNTNDVRKGTN